HRAVRRRRLPSHRRLVLRAVILGLALVALSGGAAGSSTTSGSLGFPWEGRLDGGVRLQAEGAHFFTWDPVRKRSPNRAWRRFGNDRLLRTLQRVLAGFAAAPPEAPRIGIGDLSRPLGGDFGS